MEKKQLISAKISPETLSKIDDFLKNRRYWKRNTVISSILDAVMDNFRPEDIYNMMCYSRLYRKHVNTLFSFDKEDETKD